MTWSDRAVVNILYIIKYVRIYIKTLRKKYKKKEYIKQSERYAFSKI